jgi:predicted phosphodiesterase
MSIALFTDIHGNREALEACLADARAQGAERLVFLGDLVGYGADPVFVTEKVAELVDKGAIAVMGNHDAAAVGQECDMNRTATAAIRWTQDQLQPAHFDFLLGLPLQQTEDDRLYVHASANGPAAWHYVTDRFDAEKSLNATRAKITFVGHVHQPQVYHLGADGTAKRHIPTANVDMPLLRSRQWLSVLGSVGQPRDGNPAASYAIYEPDTRALTYRRVGYDVDAAARKIFAAGLPHSLSTRLLGGH